MTASKSIKAHEGLLAAIDEFVKLQFSDGVNLDYLMGIQVSECVSLD